MNQNNRFNPVFIVSKVRYGTTIIARILGEHPDIYVVPKEFNIIVGQDGF